MNDQIREIMSILQEENAEVIQAISKCFRFGLNNRKPGKPLTNKEHLEVELGDVLAMIELLQNLGIISEKALEESKEKKFEKLKKWSTVYGTN